MPELRSLTVREVDFVGAPFVGSSPDAALHHLSHLRHLTHLVVDCSHFPRLLPGVQLACASCLVSLRLRNSSLDAYAIKATAAMPCLDTLVAYQLVPERSPHDLQCSWQDVRVQLCCPRRLVRLPQGALKRLTFSTSWHKWPLHSSDSLEDVCNEVRAAAGVLAATCKLQGLSRRRFVRLTLQWDGPVEYDTSPIIAALEPLRAVHDLKFALRGPSWTLQEVPLVAVTLPALHTFELGSDMLNLLELLQALASMPLTQCPVLDDRSWSWGHTVRHTVWKQVKDGLLALARERAALGHSLTICHQGLLTREECAGIEHELQLAINAGVVAFCTPSPWGERPTLCIHTEERCVWY